MRYSCDRNAAVRTDSLYRSDGRQVETSVLFWWEIGAMKTGPADEQADRYVKTPRPEYTSVYVVDPSRAARQLKKPAIVMRATPSMSR
jgi:hypothetical protein